MKRILLIHDLEGNILTVKPEGQETFEPIGVPFLWVELGENQFIDFNKKVDMSGEIPTFEVTDVPPSETKLLRDDLENAILELTMMIAVGGQ